MRGTARSPRSTASWGSSFRETRRAIPYLRHRLFFYTVYGNTVHNYRSALRPATGDHHGEHFGLGIGGGRIRVGWALAGDVRRAGPVRPGCRLGTGCGAPCARSPPAQLPAALGVAASDWPRGRRGHGRGLGGHDPGTDVGGGGGWILTAYCPIITCLSHPLSRPQFYPMLRI